MEVDIEVERTGAGDENEVSGALDMRILAAGFGHVGDHLSAHLWSLAHANSKVPA